jgi:hypothetical protein
MVVPPPSPIDVTLHLKEHVIQSDVVTIKYKIPYDGMVEIRLLSAQDSHIVWRSQYIQRNGDNEIRLRADRIPGGAYTYVLTYKGRNTYNNITMADRPIAPRPQQQTRTAFPQNNTGNTNRPQNNPNPTPAPSVMETFFPDDDFGEWSGEDF